MAPIFSRWDLILVMFVFSFRILAVILPIILLFIGSKKVNYIVNSCTLVAGLILAYRFGTEYLYLVIPAILSVFIKTRSSNS